MIDLNDVAPMRSRRIDLDAVLVRLREAAGRWVPELFPNGRRIGDEWRLANIRGDPPRKQGSCVLALKGERAGDWYEFDSDSGGGILSTIEHATGLSGRELIEYAAGLAGTAGPTPERAAGRPRRSGRDDGREIELILSRTAPAGGTPVETYLASRRLAVPQCLDLLFHPDLTCWDTKTGWPAMVAVVRDAARDRIGLHRTYLAADGAAKAPVPKPRKMLGAIGGGAVRLAEPAGGLLGLAEGIETALSVMQAYSILPVWAVLSAGNLEQATLPSDVQRVVILADHDASGAGRRAAETAGARLHREGRRVWIALPAAEGDDFNDLLRREGADAVRSAVEAAVEWTPHSPGMAAEPDTGAVGAVPDLPVGLPARSRIRPPMRADNGDLADATARARAVLEASNDPPWLFRIGARHAWVERDDEGRAMSVGLSEDRLRHVLALLIDWRREGRSGSLVAAHPPTVLVKNLLATPNPGLPVLAGIVSTPVFAPMGELVTERGYHPATRLLHEPPEGFEVPPVPERPVPAEIAAARSLLLDDLFGEFPFVSEAERAHALALLLLPFVRLMIDGPTPLHLIEKPSPGTGASLMVDAIARIATAAPASMMSEARDDDEWRKRITAKLRETPALVVVDNLRWVLESSSLSAALTAVSWEDRVLGRSEMARMPVRCAWVATGNNPRLSHEIARRTARIRLDARVDQPWRRTGFRHPDLGEWVRANRPALVAACLTLGRAWIAAGRPRFDGATLGSFEAWTETMGGILQVAGVPGFLANLDALYESSDAEGAIWRAFVALWWERHGAAEVGTAELFGLAGECDPPLSLGSGGDRSQRTRLGKALSLMRDRVFDMDGLKIRVRVARVSHQAKRWRLEVAGGGGRVPRSESDPGSGEHGERGERPSGHCGGDAGEHGERGEPRPDPSGAPDGKRAGPPAPRSPLCSPAYPVETKSLGERGEHGEPPIAHTRARPRAYGGKSGKCSPTFPCSPTAENQSGFGGERAGECNSDVPRVSEPPSYDAIFEAHGLDPLSDADRIEATRIWLARGRAPPG